MPQHNSSGRVRRGDRRNNRRRNDVVVIRFVRIRGVRIITSVVVIGNAASCRPFLRPGMRVGPAARCLRDAGFRLVIRRNNELVFIRTRRVF